LLERQAGADIVFLMSAVSRSDFFAAYRSGQN